MSQRNDIAEKRRIFIDGNEVPDLVYVGEITLEKALIEVPEFKKIRNIQNGVSKVPPVELRYKISKGGSALAFFRSWYLNDEEHDLTEIRTDASGTEFARASGPAAECIKFKEPDYDAASPKYAQLEVTVLPFDWIPMDALA